MFSAAAVAFALTIALTPIAIGILRRRSIGQFIQEELQGHMHKHGTPTMGGVVMIGAVVAGWLVAHMRIWSPDTGWGFTWREFQVPGLLVLVALVGMGFIGFLDDWSKVSRERNLGLSKRWKFAGQLAIAGLFAWGATKLGISLASSPICGHCTRYWPQISPANGPPVNPLAAAPTRPPVRYSSR